MKEKRILCYGDSNTWGYISGSNHQRYGSTERYPKILAKLLGSNFEIIEEGLNSRTLISEDKRPGKEGKNGYNYLIPCLDTHDPLDLVVLMLGTNELKFAYQKTPEEIGVVLENFFITTILNRKSQITKKTPKLLLIAPPIDNENTTYCKENNKYLNASKKSQELNQIYENLAHKYHCHYISNVGLETGVDGIHLTKESHNLLANKIQKEIEEMIKNEEI